MKFFLKIIIGLSFLLFVGCATKIPSSDIMKDNVADFELPHTPEEGKALIYIARPSSYGGLMRFNIYLDGQENENIVGHTKGKKYICLSVEAGSHEIFSKAENWAQLPLILVEGDILYLQQNVQMGFFSARNSLNIVPEYQGKYWVKNLKEIQIN